MNRAHGLVHLLYLAPGVPEFAMDRSWIVPEAARRPFGLSLTAATVAAFALLALAVWGVPGLTAVWPVLTAVACLLSALLFIGFWNSWLVLGVAIDSALLVAAATRPHWVQQLFGG
ncbi:hypothetical protein [Actinoplanes palleronii]|nr:hypothetical protein [Actinoplanes palleronii]